MNAVAQLAAGAAALLVIASFPFEAFLIERPWVQRLLGIEAHGIRNVHLWSFSIGARNALVGVSTLAGLWMVHYADASTGTTVVAASCIYMLSASMFMGIADLLGYWRPRGGSIRGTLMTLLLPATALITLAR